MNYSNDTLNNNYNFQPNIDISNNLSLSSFYGQSTGILCVQVESLDNLPEDLYSAGGFWFDEETTFSINCGFSTVSGCIDELACNYDAISNCNDGSCIYRELYFDCEGCINDLDQDGVCDELELEGCTDLIAENYNPFVTDDDGSCEYVEGCTNPLAENYNPDSTLDNNTCIIVGCMDSEAFNYNSEANEDDASCLYDLDYVNDSNDDAFDDGYNDGVESVECPLCPPCDNDCPGDYTGDGSVTVGDLLEFLLLFGNDCE